MPAVPSKSSTVKIIIWSVVIVAVLAGGYVALAKYRRLWPFSVATVDMSGWKTYTDTQIGFEFKYPPQYWLETFNDPQPDSFNQGLDISKSPIINLDPIPVSAWPKTAEEAKQQNPNCPNALGCDLQSDVLKRAQNLAAATPQNGVGYSLPKNFTHTEFPDGIIVQAPFVKATLDIGVDPEADVATTGFFTYSSVGDYVGILIEMPFSNQEAADPANVILGGILSTFKFTK